MNERRNDMRKSSKQHRPGLFSRLFAFLFLVWWMAVIFSFSALSGEQTAGPPPLWYLLERKGAHVFEYAVLFLLSFRYFSQTFFRERLERIILLSAGFTLMYATTDELHQLFVPLRGARLTDVCIDGGGILLAGVGLYFWKRLRKNRP